MPRAPRRCPRLQSPSPRPAQQHATETFERILEVTAQTLADIGIERLSTNLARERAGLTPPALYRYFPNKYALLSELGRRRGGANPCHGRDDLRRTAGPEGGRPHGSRHGRQPDGAHQLGTRRRAESPDPQVRACEVARVALANWPLDQRWSGVLPSDVRQRGARRAAAKVRQPPA